MSQDAIAKEISAASKEAAQLTQDAQEGEALLRTVSADVKAAEPLVEEIVELAQEVKAFVMKCFHCKAVGVSDKKQIPPAAVTSVAIPKGGRAYRAAALCPDCGSNIGVMIKTDVAKKLQAEMKVNTGSEGVVAPLGASSAAASK